MSSRRSIRSVFLLAFMYSSPAAPDSDSAEHRSLACSRLAVGFMWHDAISTIVQRGSHPIGCNVLYMSP
jgi:hypothetical protein